MKRRALFNTCPIFFKNDKHSKGELEGSILACLHDLGWPLVCVCGSMTITCIISKEVGLGASVGAVGETQITVSLCIII